MYLIVQIIWMKFLFFLQLTIILVGLDNIY